jgi:hypothetical protein
LLCGKNSKRENKKMDAQEGREEIKEKETTNLRLSTLMKKIRSNRDQELF